MSIHLTVIIKSSAPNSGELRDMLLDMVENSRKENACIRYDLYELPDQGVFIFQEEWTNQNGLDQHNQQPYIINFVTQSKRLTESIEMYSAKKIA